VPRKFNNQDLELPNGEVARIGTYMGPKGEMTIKLRLPSDYWSLTWMGRAARGNERQNGTTKITLDRSS
jgi:hypothetical protein